MERYGVARSSAAESPLPALEVENDELQALVDTNDEWIATRTGIRSRHIALTESNADLGEAAARRAPRLGAERLDAASDRS